MNTYKVTDYGVIPGASYPQTELLQKLIDRCKAEGGGTLVFPAGSYVSGTLVLCSNITLEFELNAVLYGAVDEKDYPHYDPAPIAFYEGKNGAAGKNNADQGKNPAMPTVGKEQVK